LLETLRALLPPKKYPSFLDHVIQLRIAVVVREVQFTPSGDVLTLAICAPAQKSFNSSDQQTQLKPKVPVTSTCVVHVNPSADVATSRPLPLLPTAQNKPKDSAQQTPVKEAVIPGLMYVQSLPFDESMTFPLLLTAQSNLNFEDQQTEYQLSSTAAFN
jgi:hypothetical protein